MNERLDSYNKHLMDFNRPGDVTEKKENMIDELIKMRVEKDELKKEIGKLIEYKKKRDNEYDDIWARKDYYKRVVGELEMKVEKVMELRKEEIKQMGEKLSLKTKEIQNEKEKSKNLKEECLSYRKQLRETRELRGELDGMK